MNQHYKKYKRILVANRGEIAIRILRAASELKLQTIALYTYEDRYSLHRYKADESYQIGSDDEPLKPYLNIKAIIDLAKTCKADAIHPGYGFLSENPALVKACKEAGIIFIGPDNRVMESLGDKLMAKNLAGELGLPLIKGYKEPFVDEQTLISAAEDIGYPIMVKAKAGGGGRGMRIVRSKKNLLKLYSEASKEAESAFGDGVVFLEKYIENPKHIEVQILADHHGTLYHLFERDCSVQRRFQKVVEIAPSMNLTDETKEKLYDYAMKICKAVDYVSAGTVEFLLDDKQNIYFIEVNPRIQVEHTITEEITGIDLVRAQILISMGYKLSDPIIGIKDQASIKCSGFAIQCRVTTEDPSKDFRPDYGTLIAYRSASGFGIRLDAGSAYTGAKISPFYDSMLVKVTAKGRSLNEASARLHRTLREFRIRGVKTNIGFLLNLLQKEDFYNGLASVNFIDQNPDLLVPQNWRDRGTKLLKYLAEIIVNGNPDVKSYDPNIKLKIAEVPKIKINHRSTAGTKQKLDELGASKFCQWVAEQKAIQYTDTTYRDAHQSLLATRMRTFDLLKSAEAYSASIAKDLFSMEVWGGATFDVAYRFLKEDPWKRLSDLRSLIPNTLFQMLLRGSNAVGYAAYPDNLIEAFIEKAWDSGKGIDVFRIFDSLNWTLALETSVKTVLERTSAIAEVCICYSGDITDPTKTKFDLKYYLDLAKKIEDMGAHMLAIKDMAGLLKPSSAELLITELKQAIDIPIHLHTHDTSSIQSATYLKAIEAGVDVVDLAISSMSGLTSQPNFNSVVAMMQGHDREKSIDLKALNKFSEYWETVRSYYYPFETELRAGTAEVYDHEIPGGQYSNLKPQARGLGLENKFDLIKDNYQAANMILGNLIKVTPSSKVVGDLSMFMTSNNYSVEDIYTLGNKIDFPDSVKALMRGDLGQIAGGFPKDMQEIVLKGERAYTDRPNEHLKAIDFQKEFKNFQDHKSYELNEKDFISSKLYPRVYEQYLSHYDQYGDVVNLPSAAFFFGLKPNEEIMVKLGRGKNILIKYLNMTLPNEKGIRLVFFTLNGQMRSIEVRDNVAVTTEVRNQKIQKDSDVGSPLQGSIAQMLVNEGDQVEANTPLFIVEAMKMESTITSTAKGIIKKIYLKEKSLVEQDDLVIEME